MRLLFVEDEEKISDVVARGLRAEGYAIDLAQDGIQGLEMIDAYAYDLVILDVMLPRLSGTQLLQRVREKDKSIPIIMLSAKDSTQDKVYHIENGADDYMTKPFSQMELLVRIRALLRRAPAQKEDIIRLADLEVDRLCHQVRRGGKHIDLSAKEFSLIEYLALHGRRVLSRSMIIEHVWDQSFEGLTNIVDVYIRQLRSKIDDGHERKLIRTVRKVGYVLSDEPTE